MVFKYINEMASVKIIQRFSKYWCDFIKYLAGEKQVNLASLQKVNRE